jgi:hypothetical protein
MKMKVWVGHVPSPEIGVIIFSGGKNFLRLFEINV